MYTGLSLGCFLVTAIISLTSSLYTLLQMLLCLLPAVMLLDVGTVPKSDALVHMYSAMEDQPDCGGAAGEIRVRK